jgi:uncharacterized membrane protein YfbV (UPF0208 family)
VRRGADPSPAGLLVLNFSFHATRFAANLSGMLGIITVSLDFPVRFMHNVIPLVLAALVAVGIIVIGCFYLYLLSES